MTNVRGRYPCALRESTLSVALLSTFALACGAPPAPVVHHTAPRMSFVSAEQDDEARRIWAQGREAFDRGELETALLAFVESYGLSRRPYLLQNVLYVLSRLDLSANEVAQARSVPSEQEARTLLQNHYFLSDVDVVSTEGRVLTATGRRDDDDCAAAFVVTFRDYWVYYEHEVVCLLTRDPVRRERACEQGNHDACVALFEELTRSDDAAGWGRVVSLAAQSCPEGRGRLCRYLAIAHERGLGEFAVDPERALDHHEAACQAGAADSCLDAAAIVADRDHERARRAWSQGCADGNAQCCAALEEESE